MQSTKVGTDFTTDKLVGVPDCDRRLGRARPGARRAHAGLRRRRQPQEPADRLRELRHPQPEARASPTASTHRRHRRRRLLRRLLRQRGSRGERGRRRRRDELARRGGREHDQERRQHVQGAEQPHLRAGVVRRRTTTSDATLQPRAATPASRTSCSGKATPTSAARSRRDKLWFFAAYNHFKIDKQISGVPRDIATDLGIFDNYTTKGTWKVSQNDTVDRLLPVGPEAEAEPRPVGDRVARGGAAAGQRLLGLQGRALSACGRNRLFTDVKVNLFGYDFPLGVKADYKAQPPRLDTGTNFTSGAAWDAFDLGRGRSRRSPRSRPTTCRQATGSHDLKVGFEYLLDIAKYAIDGRSGPIQYRDLNGGDRPRSASSTSATTPTSATAGRGVERSRPALRRLRAGPLEPEQPRRPSPPACAGITSVRTTWTASAIR